MWKPHRIDFHLLMIVTGGTGRHTVDFEGYVVERGSLVHIGPNQVHQFERDGDFDAFLVLFVPSRLDEAAPRADWPARATVSVRHLDLLEPLARVMLDLGRQRSSASAQRARQKLLMGLLEIARSAIRASSPAAVRPTIPLLDALDTLLVRHLPTTREVSWYADQLGTSVRTLTRRCRQRTGGGAKEYIDRRVVLEAKRVLVHSDLSVEAIAGHLGFSEATNFVKFFKRYTGTTPAAFRRSYESPRHLDDVDRHRAPEALKAQRERPARGRERASK